MAKKPIAVDLTTPTVKVTLNDKEYTLCLNQRALAEAEMELIREGHNVNLLYAYMALNLSNLRVIFPCTLRKFHPELSYEQAQDLVTPLHSRLIAEAVSPLWIESQPEPDKDAKNE